MLFERLLIENLGIFKGAHSIELLPTGTARPIVLVGALNGSGKTTVIEALQLALYGKRAAYGWRGAASYTQYLERTRNRHAKPTEPTVAEVTLRLADGRRVRVRRHWSFSKTQPREYISVYLNDAPEPDLTLSETWEEEVERLLPARLSELFFFDGERIEKLADPTQSADVLRAAVASLLGLDLVDHLVADLDILRTRQRQKFLADSDRAQLEALNAQYDLACQEREDLLQNKAAISVKLDRAEAERAAIDRKVHEQGGDRFQQRELLASQVAAEQGRIAALDQQLRQVATGALPLKLVTPLLVSMRDDAVRKINSTDARTNAALTQQLKKLSQWVSHRPFSKSVKTELHEYVRLATIRLSNNHCMLDDKLHWERLESRLDGLLTSVLREASESATMVIEQLAVSSEKLHALQERLAQVPEQEQLAAILRTQGAAQATVSLLTAEAIQYDQQLQVVERTLHLIRQQRTELVERATESVEATRISDYCQRSAKTLAVYRANLVQRRREQLEQLILEAFQLLARKSDLVGQVKLDNETMAVTLLTPDGQTLLTQQLSAGERQLLAVAMLWGLARASGRPVPVVIDTPLGRLDGDHRRTLVERYFPDASHQVILLSTDQEVDADFSQLLDDSVAHRYLIGYDESRRSSAFSPGYFSG
jgi:DNA sulfur modification protein DndD